MHTSALLTFPNSSVASGTTTALATPTFNGVNKTYLMPSDFTTKSAGLKFTNGKITATTAGVTETGSFDLASPIDWTKPFSINTILECNDPNDVNPVSISIINSTGAPVNETGMTQSLIGGPAAYDNDKQCLYAPGMGFVGRPTGAVPAIGQYEAGATSDATGNVTMFHRPLGTRTGGGARYGSNSGSAGAGVNQAQEVNSTAVITVPQNYQFAPTWYGLNRVVVTTASTSNAVVAVFISQGDVIGPLDNMSRHFALNPVIANSIVTPNVGAIVLGKGYDGRARKRIAFWGHPNNSDELSNTQSATFANAIAEGARDAGFINTFILGDQLQSANLAAALNSPWGGPNGCSCIYAGLNGVRTVLPYTETKMIGIGSSQGLVNILLLHRRYPNLFKGIIGISGVANLSGSYTGAGGGSVFKTQIDTGWGTSTQADIDPFSPVQNPSYYTGIPIVLYHGTSDTIIPKSTNADAFATAVNALPGGNVTVISVTGGGHLDTAMYAGINTVDFVTRMNGFG